MRRLFASYAIDNNYIIAGVDLLSQWNKNEVDSNNILKTGTVEYRAAFITVCINFSSYLTNIFYSRSQEMKQHLIYQSCLVLI
jgi:hypothetical protein